MYFLTAAKATNRSTDEVVAVLSDCFLHEILLYLAAADTLLQIGDSYKTHSGMISDDKENFYIPCHTCQYEQPLVLNERQLENPDVSVLKRHKNVR